MLHDVASPVPPDVLSGPRLDLVLVTVEQMLARFESDGPVLLGYDDPDDVLHPDESPLHWRVPMVREDPSVNPWLIRIAVERATATIVGQVNFHAPPDEHGVIDIGYSVLPRFRGQGYATEIAHIMWSYAAHHPDVRVLRANVRPDNEPSRRIIEGAGFVKVDEEIDPEDGLEYVYELTAAGYRARFPA